ncbi:hypothetical protein F5Y03DRAFT_364161 [Xylaria venustula]|nr:hypothetical protein F5Y03DRAFT_364161 [Xylaria venustula]
MPLSAACLAFLTTVLATANEAPDSALRLQPKSRNHDDSTLQLSCWPVPSNHPTTDSFLGISAHRAMARHQTNIHITRPRI